MKKDLPKAVSSKSSPITIIEKWIDKQDILQMLHISVRTLQRWRSLGKLPYYKVAGKIYYKESELMELLNSCRQEVRKR